MTHPISPFNQSNNNPSDGESAPIGPLVVVSSSSVALDWRLAQLSWWQSWGASFLAHILFVVLYAVISFLIAFFGWGSFMMSRPERIPDIEFQLVEAPEATPNAPTRNRAEHNTRAGGQKVPNMHEAESHKQAGGKPARSSQAVAPAASPQKQQQPQRQPRRTTKSNRPTPQPRAVAPTPDNSETKAPTPTPNTSPTPQPPRPRTKAPPRPSSTPSAFSSLPNPLSPIKTPSSSGGPSESGPIVKHGGGRPGGSSGGSPNGSPGPATMPGQFSSAGGRPSQGSAGGNPGSGGQSAYNQAGSPGGGGGRPGINAQAEPNFGPYLAELQRRIRRNWTPPEDRLSKTVVVVFSVGRDGRLLNLRVSRSSGDAVADQSARAAVERSAPFRPLPPEFRGNNISVEFTFDYKYLNSQMGGFQRH